MIFSKYSRVYVSVIITRVCILVPVHGIVSGYTGNEIVLKLGNAQFVPITGTTNYQIKVNVNYSLSDPTLTSQKINAVMKVLSQDGTVLKTTSFPSGFGANMTGTAELLTNIPKILARNITTEIVFTDLNKTNILSNTIQTLPHLEDVKTSESMPTITNTT